MSDSLGFILAIVISEIIPASISAFAAYWALSIRKALAGRIYRSHALWLGVVCIFTVFANFFTYSNDPTVNAAFTTYYILIFVVLFAFIDSTVTVARRSDPLLRGILSWPRLRIVVWADIAVLAIFMVASNYPPFVATFNSDLANYVWTFVATVPFIVGGSAILVGARRSRDSTLKNSLKWLGIALLFIFILFLDELVESTVFGVGTFDQYYSYPAIPAGAISIMLAFGLYKSVRSLAPVNRLSSLETSPGTAPT